MKRKIFLITLFMAMLSGFSSYADPGTQQTQAIEQETTVEPEKKETSGDSEEWEEVTVPDIERSFPDDKDEDDSDSVELTIHISVPDGFKDHITVYLNGIPRYFTYQEDAENHGYSSTTEIQPGLYTVKVVDDNDYVKQYSFNMPETYDTSSEGPLQITVQDNMPNMMVDDGFDYDGGAPEETYTPVSEDFSDGLDHGSLHIKMLPCEAVQSATVTLQGDDSKKYHVTLDHQHNYEAEITVPVGTYTELPDIDVKLISNRSTPEGMTFSWAHEGNLDSFGNNYVVNKDQETEITDLTILVRYGGKIQEISAPLMDSFQIQKVSESLEDAKLENVAPTTETAESEEAETESEPDDAELEKQNRKKDLIHRVILVAGFMVFAGGGILLVKKRRP